MALLTGTNGNDVLTGTMDDDWINGLLGDDLLAGRGGDDVIDGGEGGDRINGGNGNDFLLGGDGYDTIQAGTGNDLVDGGTGDDQLSGDEGSDFLFGGDGNDLALGGNGDDLLDGGFGRDGLVGGDGRDTIRGGGDDDGLNGLNGNDVLEGGDGNDILDGGMDRDLLLGGAGNDSARGGYGRDTLDGGLGNDALLGEGGNDTISGGDGNDSIDGDGVLRFFLLGANNTLIMVDPSQLGQTTTVTISNLPTGVTIQKIDRRPADDLLYAIASNNKIYTLDYFSGAATEVSTLNLPFFNAPNQPTGIGLDFNPVPDRLRLVGSDTTNFRINADNGMVADNDANTPGLQPDTALAYVTGDPNFAGPNVPPPNIVEVAYTNNLPGVTATRLFAVDATRDTLVRVTDPNNGKLQTIGNLGIDIKQNASFDILTTATGDSNVGLLVNDGLLYQVELIPVDPMVGMLVNPQVTLIGQIGDGTQTLSGLAIATPPEPNRSGNDEIFGGAGNDVINGNVGNDSITGDMGNDTLLGGLGDDTLTGGDGADSFVFRSGRAFQSADFGRDRILDFTPDLDKIVLSQRSFGMLMPNQIAFVANDGQAETSNGSIVYSQSSGRLFFNQNGSTSGFGTGSMFARLQNTPTLTANDFVIVA